MREKNLGAQVSYILLKELLKEETIGQQVSKRIILGTLEGKAK